MVTPVFSFSISGVSTGHSPASIQTNQQEGGSGSRVGLGVHAGQACQYCMFASKHQAGPGSDDGTPGASKRVWNLCGVSRQAEGSCWYLWDL